jgi:dTDP-4-amino-4,6-dideoxygalactose transaminase
MINKIHLNQLAIISGTPAFEDLIHVGRPNIGDRQELLARINKILDNRWLSNNGPYVQELEQRISEKLNVKHCIVMCNGTVALEIAIRAVELRGEVILPSFTFVATAHALQWQEITPVFCDIDPTSHHLNPAMVEKMITPKTTGIIGVHLWGRPCDIKALTDISAEHNLKLLFDAAHSFGSTYNGKCIGNFGDAEVFSFHATKFFNTFEGGAITTNNDQTAAKIRLMKNFGFAGYDKVIYVGTNGKMTEVCAAMGLTNLESYDEFTKTNHSNYKHYQEHLAKTPGIRLLSYDENEPSNYQYIVLEIDEHICEITRDQLLKVLHQENILARRYFFPGCHRMEPYRSNYPHAGLLLPETERLSERVLILPTGTTVKKTDIESICNIIKLAIENGQAISKIISNRESQA